jgi:hypothetical protein
MIRVAQSEDSTALLDDLRIIAREAGTTESPALEEFLYTNFYARPRERASDPSTRDDRMRFLAELSLANTGTGHWEIGWNAAARDGDTIVVHKRGIHVFAKRDQVRLSDELGPASRARLRIEKELRALIPGFYCALGDADGSDDPDAPLLRLYWNLRADGAAPYIALVTSKFNAAGIPFSTKVLSDPASYIRADAGVLYVERTHVRAIARIVHRIYDELKPLLFDPVPMFSKRLADGLAWAEDPGGGRSFGQTRCQAIARGLRACADRSPGHHEYRYRAIRAALEADGIDPAAPYLCGGTTDAYASLSMQ